MNAEELIAQAEFHVEWATTLRLMKAEKAANQKLRKAVDLYMDAGEYEMAQTCRMLITSE